MISFPLLPGSVTSVQDVQLIQDLLGPVTSTRHPATSEGAEAPLPSSQSDQSATTASLHLTTRTALAVPIGTPALAQGATDPAELVSRHATGVDMSLVERATRAPAEMPPLLARLHERFCEEDAFVQVNRDGWGDPQQVYVWDMASFGGYLYASTLNLDGTQSAASGVEGAAAIYRWDGSGAWEVVTTTGLGNENNDGFRRLFEWNDMLYTVTLNDTEGGEIWRSADGMNWEQVVSGGFNDPSNLAIRDLIDYNGKLYATVQNDGTGGGEIWRSPDGETWVQVAGFSGGGAANSSVHTLMEFDGFLYAGTRNTVSGAQIWRSADGMSWEQAVGPISAEGSGFGNANNTVIFQMIEFGGALYATTANPEDGFGMFRSLDGLNWEQVGAYGFGDPDQHFGWRMQVFEGALWLGTANDDPEKGAALWRSEDGVTWGQLVGGDGTYDDWGFGTDANWGVRSFAIHEDELYIGTANMPYNEQGLEATGAEVYVWTDPDPVSTMEHDMMI